MHGDLAQRRRIFLLQARRAPARHSLPPQRRAARPPGPLRLPARRRDGRVLVDLLAARRQGPGEARSTSAATASPTRSSPATTTDLHAEQTIFIPLDDDVELWDVRIRNNGATPRELSVFSYVEFSFHHIEIDNQNLQMSLYASGSSYAGRHHRIRLLLRALDLPLLRRQLRARQLRLPARQLPRQLPHRDQPDRGGAGRVSATARNWAAITAARCTSG